MKQLKLDHEQLGTLCRALGQMYHAGIFAGDALALMAEDEPLEREKKLLQDMSRMADDGMSLAEIFHKAGCFPAYLCNLMTVGEEVGRSEETLNALADYYDGRARLAKLLKNTLLYPAVLLLTLLAVIFVLLIWVLPVFNDVYARLGSSLKGVAGGLLLFGTFLRKALPFLGGVMALILLGVLILAAAPALRQKFFDRWQYRMGDKGIGRRINTARFLQAVALGMSGGLTDREAVELASSLAEGSRDFTARCETCLTKINDGEGLGTALREAELLTKAQSRLLETGIRAGNGEEVIGRIAKKALEDSEQELESLTGRIEPIVVMVLSVLVGAILLSVMLPLMHIMTAIG